MDTGRIIFLNGTSSSGKSSIARELLDVLDDGVFFHLAVDAFNAMRTKRELGPAELESALRRTRTGFHRAIAAMAEAGNDVVVDHVLSEPWRLRDCLAVLPAENVLFVGVHCPLDELVRREAARGDRPPGLAALQYELVHRHGVYDLECDTSTASPRACAEQIRDFLPHRPSPTAFMRLRGLPAPAAPREPAGGAPAEPGVSSPPTRGARRTPSCPPPIGG
ncbi:chloramphenicol phosphotransferase CPT family protein [Streptomyces sp. NPDC102406]|uniref:chloramphenicol phosphotransferase CPT family protein n=1 Tax=Streptomyces sp. NPDC102406 TaxID=3366171 RepID=UPI00382EC7A1